MPNRVPENNAILMKSIEGGELDVTILFDLNVKNSPR